MYVGESIVAPLEPIGEPFVVNAHEVHDGGLQVVDVDAVFYTAIAEVVGSTVDIAGLYAAPCHPDTEGMGVVVTTKEFGTASFFVHGGTPELATPDDEGFFEETTLFEVSEECRDRLVGLFTFFG